MTSTELFRYAIARPGDPRDYVPFVGPGVNGGLAQFGEIALIREAGHSGNALFVGFWRVEPSTSPLYNVPGGDETGYVVGGRARIDLLADDQETVVETEHLGPGDVYTFRKGLLQRWTVTEAFEKFVIVADPEPAPELPEA